MDIPSGVKVLVDRMGIYKQNEERFWQWVNPNEDEELFAVFDAAIRSLYVLKQVAHIQSPYVNVELTHALERIVSHAFAVLALLEKGFVAEALSTLRTVGEGRNLMLLLTRDENELQSYLSANEDQRDKKFRSSKVRTKLKGLGLDPFMYGQLYTRVSRRFVHFSTGSISLNSNAYNAEVLGWEYYQRNMILAILSWAWTIHVAMRLAPALVKYPQDDVSITRLISESGAANEVLEARLKEELGTV